MSPGRAQPADFIVTQFQFLIRDKTKCFGLYSQSWEVAGGNLLYQSDDCNRHEKLSNATECTRTQINYELFLCKLRNLGHRDQNGGKRTRTQIHILGASCNVSCMAVGMLATILSGYFVTHHRIWLAVKRPCIS